MFLLIRETERILNAYKILVWKYEGRKIYMGVWIVLKMIFKHSVLWCGLDSSGFGRGPQSGSFQHSNRPSGSIRGEEIFDQLDDQQLIKKDCVSCSCMYFDVT